MTKNRNFKRLVRARSAKTGESYCAALHRLRPAPTTYRQSRTLKLAVAQTSAYDDPTVPALLRAGGREVRSLMLDASNAGARLVHFPEGAICAPNKRVMSSAGRDNLSESDWTRFEWDVLAQELESIRVHAAELGIWCVFGSAHRLTPPHRPHNSLYVISNEGMVVTRYDERMLSFTKISFMYAPGRSPVTFDVDGFRFGCTLGMECHYPELFMEYEQLGVDCVLFSTTGDNPALAPPFASEVQGHAASNSFWVSYSCHAPQSVSVPSGVVGPEGQWAQHCTADGRPSIGVVDIQCDPAHPARPWRRAARAQMYSLHQIDGDPRSDGRDQF